MSAQMSIPGLRHVTGTIWQQVPDGDPVAALLYRDHYSCYQYADHRRDDPTNHNRWLIAGPGYKIVLLTPDEDALFVWRKFKDASGQQGINCSVFRNTGTHLSSWLIEQAEQVVWQRWPGERLYTYVKAAAVKSSNPGYCFKRAGWRACGTTKVNKLLILEQLGDAIGNAN